MTETTPPGEHPNLATALAAFQRTLPSIRKGETARVTSDKGSYTYDYADLTDVSEAVLPEIAAQGLAWFTSLDTDENGTVILTWSLIHGASGEERSGSLPVGRAGAQWQAIGSAITYARRYALTAATGVAPGGDDNDGADAPPTPDERPRARRQAPPQSPIARQPENLPEGLYDLGAIDSTEAAREVFRQARAAGHLHLLVGVPQESGEIVGVPLGDWLTAAGKRLEVDPEAHLRAEIAAHEAEMDEAEAGGR